MSMSAPRIIGIVLVKNEDLFIRQVLVNLSGFCDEIIVADNMSSDKTADIIKELAVKFSQIHYHQIKSISQSHKLIQGYAGQNIWMFGVDGDEIYDPAGLSIFRSQLLAGKFKEWWLLFGNVLHCTAFDPENKEVSGYLSPPCRSMTKLYNFNLIKSWQDSSGERLHGGNVIFKNGYDESLRCYLHEENSWDDAVFRCLHMCFLKRSSMQKSWKGQYVPRQNPADILSQTRLQWLQSALRKIVGLPVEGKQEWKMDKFTRGAVETRDVTQFFKAG